MLQGPEDRAVAAVLEEQVLAHWHVAGVRVGRGCINGHAAQGLPLQWRWGVMGQHLVREDRLATLPAEARQNRPLRRDKEAVSTEKAGY